MSLITRKVKTIQSKHKYSHKEKKDYKQSGVTIGWNLFWNLETLFSQSGSDKKKNQQSFAKGLVKDKAVVPRVAGKPLGVGQGGLSQSSPIWLQKLYLAMTGGSVNSPCFVWFSLWHLQRCKLLFKSGPWLSVSIRHFHIPVFIYRLKYWDF